MHTQTKCISPKRSQWDGAVIGYAALMRGLNLTCLETGVSPVGLSAPAQTVERIRITSSLSDKSELPPNLSPGRLRGSYVEFCVGSFATWRHRACKAPAAERCW